MLKKVMLALAVMFSIVLAGCGSSAPKTLEDYMNTDEGKEEMAKIQEQADEMASSFGSLEVKVEANNIVYLCKFDATFDENPFTDGAFDDATIKELGTAIEDMEKETGCSGCTMEYIFQDSAGTELYRVKIDKNGIVE